MGPGFYILLTGILRVGFIDRKEMRKWVGGWI